MYLLVFCSTFFLYNFQRLWLLPYPLNTLSERHAWIEKYARALKIMSFAAFVMCLNALRILSYVELGMGILLLLLGVLYSYFPNQNPLRNVGWFKTVLVALVWTLSVFFFESFSAILNNPWPLCRFCILVYLLTLLFEFRDKSTDTAATLPRILSIKHFKIVLIGLNLSVIVIDGFAHQFLLMGLDVFILPLLLALTFKKKGDLFYSFYVDGYLIVSAVVYALKY